MSIMKQAIVAELQELITKSVVISNTIKTAKTQLKRTIFKGKQSKINNKIADLSNALDRIESKQQAGDES